MNVDRFVVVVRQLSEEEGGGFWAGLPDLPGCFGDGETAEDAVSDARLAAQAWIEATEAMGRQVPEPGVAVKRIKEREEALVRAVRALATYAETADHQIGKLEAQLDHLIRLLEEEGHEVRVPEAAILAQQSHRIAHH